MKGQYTLETGIEGQKEETSFCNTSLKLRCHNGKELSVAGDFNIVMPNKLSILKSEPFNLIIEIA